MRETPETTPAAAPPPRLHRIEIRNYKALDALDLEFPAPLMAGDPDITVVGSANGVGKTSLLECCALAHLNQIDPNFLEEMLNGIDLAGEWRSFIRDGQTTATVIAEHLPGDRRTVSLQQHRDHETDDDEFGLLPGEDSEIPTQAFFARNENPLSLPGLLLLHSFRRVRSGTIPASQLLGGKGGPTDHPEPLSLFKQVTLSAMMGRAGLIEGISATDAATNYEKLDELLATFADCRLAKLRGLTGDFELRVTTPQKLNFSFDGLSSGQQEIVSTLFLIWHATLNQPALVLIDEPELHLNAEWHRTFVRHLHKLAPNNQYILASHSEHIFASVDPERRILLAPRGAPR